VSNNESNEMTQPQTESEAFRNAELQGRERAAQLFTGRPQRVTRPLRHDDFTYTFFEHMRNTAGKHLSDKEFVHAYVTAQMSAKKGLKIFKEDGAGALMKELRQVIVMNVMSGCHARELSMEEKKRALRYLMFLKQKRCGLIKGRGCVDGRPQRLWKTKDQTTSPTVSIEALLISCMIDAMEGRDVATIDIPSAFMQAFIDETIHIKFDNELIDLLCEVDPSLKQFVSYENGKRVLYTKLNKALYGTVQASRLFWERLSSFLIDKNGFERNPYDFCVVNKVVNGKQLTIVWYVDDLKISHVDSTVVDDMIEILKKEFGQVSNLTVRRGKVHDYLGMKFDFSTPGKVILSMDDYISQLLEETPEELLKGAVTSPAGNYLFNVNPKCERLDSETAAMYHHLTAKLLYLAKRVRPDLQPAVSFLCTRVQSPDKDDWKKLGRCLTFLRDTKHEPLTLSADGSWTIRWWVDASYAVHPDMKGHTGATMSLGQGCVYSMSTKQKLNTRSSTEAELVAVNDAMSKILWTRLFIEAQGYGVSDNVVYQDNQSAILLEKNGKLSSSKRTRHLEIRFFFVTDNVEKNASALNTVRRTICLAIFIPNQHRVQSSPDSEIASWVKQDTMSQ
jgi:Reverse transcriptase (RNA-dependent DNA polymerase)